MIVTLNLVFDFNLHGNPSLLRSGLLNLEAHQEIWVGKECVMSLPHVYALNSTDVQVFSDGIYSI